MLSVSAPRVRLARRRRRPHVGGAEVELDLLTGDVLDVPAQRRRKREVRGVHRVRHLGVVDRGDADDLALGTDRVLERPAHHPGPAVKLEQADSVRVGIPSGRGTARGDRGTGASTSKARVSDASIASSPSHGRGLDDPRCRVRGEAHAAARVVVDAVRFKFSVVATNEMDERDESAGRQNSPRPRDTMSAVSLLANRGAPAISHRIERVGAREAATGDAGVASRRGRREALVGSLLGVGTSSIFRARAADESSGTSPVSAPDAAPRRPAACATGTSCVSTSSFRTPANYLPPWD